MKQAANKAASSLFITGTPDKLQELFKDRVSQYITDKGRPTQKLIRLLCNGDDYMKNKLRKMVEIY